MTLCEDESAEFGVVPTEHSSPVSVLDAVEYKHDSSPVKYVGKTLKGMILLELILNLYVAKFRINKSGVYYILATDFMCIYLWILCVYICLQYLFLYYYKGEAEY